MLVNVLQWRAGIGNLHKCTHPQIKIKYASRFSFNIRIISLGFFQSFLSDLSLSAFCLNLFYQICLVQHGDIELNPGPNKKLMPLTCWDVNSLTAYKMFR